MTLSGMGLPEWLAFCKGRDLEAPLKLDHSQPTR
jgi:hypothetical protein